MIRLEIPAVPPSLNAWSRMHWAVRARHARTWRMLVAYHAIAASVPRRLLERPVIVTLTFRLTRGGDAVNREKFVMDGLVGVFLRDDSPAWVHELRLRAERGSPARTLIEIEEVTG